MTYGKQRQTHNPDVLNCLANLSSDEVFTPPKVAEAMLDLLPGELWSDPDATFLDPACKSGVFLREIARRLNAGLAEAIPDPLERANHIFREQVYGLPITELTAMLSRRSLYGSKAADGKFAFGRCFDDAEGNIRLGETEHNWVAGRCTFCGASESNYDRAEGLESHSYPFIHTDDPKGIFGMKFDVIVGNPPYQLSDGGHGRSASPIYNKFVEQAKKLEPRFLSLIIPARWYGGGKGLNAFRSAMLEDSRLRTLVDFEDAGECFPGVDIAGGVCYFLWERDHEGDCTIINRRGDREITSKRALNEYDTLIRHGEAISIIRKVAATLNPPMSETVSSAKPFGLRTFARPKQKGELQLRWNGGEGPYPREDVEVGIEMIDRWKVITSKVSYDHAGQPDKNQGDRIWRRLRSPV